MSRLYYRRLPQPRKLLFVTPNKLTTNSELSRRSLSAQAAAALAPASLPACAAVDLTAAPAPSVPNGINTFFDKWVSGWNARDAHALAKLHTDDAVTINRYGTLIEGRLDSEKALAFLLGPAGPFGDAVFPLMVIRKLREIAPNVAITQVDWSAPVLGADGKVKAGEWNDMVLTYCLIKSGQNWLMTQADGHNIEPMDLPYSQSEQKK